MQNSPPFSTTFGSATPARQGVIQQCSTFNVTTAATNYAANETFSSSSSGSFTSNVTGGMPTSIISSTSGVLNVDIDAPFRPATDILVPVTAGHKYSIDFDVVGFSSHSPATHSVRCRVEMAGYPTQHFIYTTTSSVPTITVNVPSGFAGTNIRVEIASILSSSALLSNPYIHLDNFVVKHWVGVVNTSFDTVCNIFGGGYKYGFNGMEKDDEIYGSGNAYTAMFWEYDSRLGKRWNTDPIIKPWESSYACFLNNPIRVIDPNGDDGYVDADGNYLGDDGDKKSHKTRVITAEKWKTIVGNTKQGEFSDDMRNTLQNGFGKKTTIKGHDKFTEDDKQNPNSKLLNEYEKGISISDETWKTLTDNKGTKLTPFVINESDKEAWYKSENDVLNPYATGNYPNPIAPKTSLYSPIDGLATHKYKDAVYKVTTGSNNIRIMADGDIKSSKHLLANDGWIDKDGTGDFFHWKNLDKNWDPLYEKAKSTGGSDY